MKKVNELFNQTESILGKLVTRVQDLHLLNNTVKKILDEDFPHYHISSFDKGILNIVVYSGADATRLRYQSNIIISKLRQYPQWAGIASIKIKVQVPQTIYKPVPPEVQQPMSEANKEQLKALAESLRNDPTAKALVEKLEKLGR